MFEILAREHADMLVGYLRSVTRTSEAVDDLFQETMLTAWRRLEDYDRSRPFGPWLRGIASRLVLRAREREGRDILHCDSSLLDALEGRFETVTSRGDDFPDAVQELLRCLRRLPEKLSASIRLAYEQGLRLREVADRLESSEEAVKKRIQRGRKLLAECLRSTKGATT